MLIEQALYELLSGDTAITAEVGSRIYPKRVPQKPKGENDYPVLVYELVERERRQTHDGPDGLVASRFGIYALAKGYLEAKQLADLVRKAANGKTAALRTIYGRHVKGVFLQDEFDDDKEFDEVEELFLFRVTQDWSIHHDEEVV